MQIEIAGGRTDKVIDHIRDGGSPAAQDANGKSIIRWCAHYGDVSAIKILLLAGEKLGSLGENLNLGEACFHGHWRLCQFLIERGADVNYPLPETHETPLHLALCQPGRPAYNVIVKLLLAKGANPRRVTKENASGGSHLWHCRTKGETPLHRAAAFANPEMIDLLIEAGASKEAKDMNGDSPLSWASWHMRAGAVMQKLCYGDIKASERWVARIPSDHGCGWGNGMETNLLGSLHL